MSLGTPENSAIQKLSIIIIIINQVNRDQRVFEDKKNWSVFACYCLFILTFGLQYSIQTCACLRTCSIVLLSKQNAIIVRFGIKVGYVSKRQNKTTTKNFLKGFSSWSCVHISTDCFLLKQFFFLVWCL